MVDADTTDPAPGRRTLLVAIAIALVAVAVFVLWWFQPQKLFIDDTVSDTIPVVTAPPTTAAPSTDGATSSSGVSTPTIPATTTEPVSTEPVELFTGDFVSLDHGTSGVLRVLELADGSRIVRFEGLDTDNGPDLFVYLTTNPAGGPESAFDDDFVNLGRLRGNRGDQNYDVAADVDLDRFASVVIWCDRFDSAFGAADLVPA